MIRTPGRELVCVFGKETWPDEMFLYVCDQCGFAVCSEHSEWVKVDSQEKTGFTQPVTGAKGWYVRVCLSCISPGLTYAEWFAMDGPERAHVHDIEFSRGTVEGSIEPALPVLDLEDGAPFGDYLRTEGGEQDG